MTFQCDGCAIKVMGVMDIGQGKLCLNCYGQYQNGRLAESQAFSLKLTGLMEQSTWATEMIEFQLGIRDAPPRKHNQYRGITMNQNLNFTNSAVGLVNTGSIYSESLVSSVQLNQDDQKELNNSLSQLILAIKNNEEFTKDQKKTLTDSLDFIQEEVNKSPEKRKLSIIKGAVDAVSKLVGTVDGISRIWHSCHPFLSKFFHL